MKVEAFGSWECLPTTFYSRGWEYVITANCAANCHHFRRIVTKTEFEACNADLLDFIIREANYAFADKHPFGSD